MSGPDAADAPPETAAAAETGYAAAAEELDETAVIRRYASLVKRAALHLKGRLPEAMQLDDLVQAGLMAILRVLRQGGPAANEAALRRIVLNAMLDEARRENWAPVRTVRLARTAAAAMRTVKRRTGRDGTDAEIAAEMQLSVAEYHKVLIDIAGIRPLQLDAFDAAGEDRLQVAGSQEATVQRRALLAALTAAVAALPVRERLVVSLYYERELNMEEVGAVLGLSKSSVCRAHGRALLMLRNALSEWRSEAAAAAAIAGG